MDFRQIKTFLTVVDTGNITRAAEILHLVQPAVSRQIKLLEEDLAVSLFERQRHGMVLTEAGRTLVTYARRSLLELERARAEIGGADEGIGGLVTIGLVPSTIDALSSTFVSAIKERYPAIKIRLTMGYAGTLVRWLEAGEIDAALLFGAERSPHIQTTPLLEEPLWVIWSKQAHIQQVKSMALADLARHPIVLPSAPHGIRTLVDHACAVSNIELNIVAEANALSVQRRLVLDGLGLTILPPIAVKDELQARQLHGAPLSSPDISRLLSLALPMNRPIAKPVRCAVEVLAGCARSAVATGAWPEGRWLSTD